MIDKKVQDFFKARFPKLAHLDKTESYRGSGALDSLGTLELVESLESYFGIQLEDHEITEANLGSTQKLEAFMKVKLQ